MARRMSGRYRGGRPRAGATKIKMAPENASEQFRIGCNEARIPTTNRQWAKWQRHIGLAWTSRKKSNE